MRKSDTPTAAQRKYLENARAVMDAGTGVWNYFHICGPGPKRTGMACSRRGWLALAYGGKPIYWLNTAGRAALEAAERSETQ